MEPIEEKLKAIIARHLSDGMADLEVLPNGRIVGHVVSSDFEDLDYDDRRKRLREILKRELSADEAKRLSTLLTYTPEEWNVAL